MNLKTFRALGYRAFMSKKYRNRKYMYKSKCIIIYTENNVYYGSVVCFNKAQAKEYNKETSHASGTIYSRKEAKKAYPELFKTYPNLLGQKLNTNIINNNLKL